MEGSSCSLISNTIQECAWKDEECHNKPDRINVPYILIAHYCETNYIVVRFFSVCSLLIFIHETIFQVKIVETNDIYILL